MEDDYDYVKVPSSNVDDKFYLSFNDNGNTWSPAEGDSSPSVTITVNNDQDTYIESITIDATENVKNVLVVVVNANGDKSDPISKKPDNSDGGSVTVTLETEGTQIIVTFEPQTPNKPEEIAVGQVAVKACAEALCSEELEESSFYNVRVSSNPAEKKGLRIAKQPSWSPEATDGRPTIRIFMNAGRNVYMDSIRISEATGVAGFSVAVMAIDSEPGARPVRFAQAGTQLNGNTVGESVKLDRSGAIIVVSLFGDIPNMSVGPVFTTACSYPETNPQTSETTDYKSVTISSLTLSTEAVCVVSPDAVAQYYPDAQKGDLIGYIDSDGNKEQSDDEKVLVGDEVESDVVILLSDLCHNCTCDDGTLTCSQNTCERDCKLHDWSKWGPCSAECGGGVRERNRDFTPGTPGGEPCPCAHSMKEKEYCNEQPCEVDGEWSTWSPWSTCSASCGGGITRRYRSCDNPEAANGGDDCEGEAIEVQTCLTEACPKDENKECGDNKVWSSNCDGPVSCYDYADSGALIKDVCEPGCRCKDGMVDDGSGECVVPADECNCFDPETGNVFQNGQSAKRDQGNDCEECSCEEGILTCAEVECNRDCGYTEWSDWKTCTNLMGGEMRRYREPNNPPALGNGKPCDEEELVDTAPCGNETCAHCVIDGVTYAQSEVIEYEPCKKTCFCNSEGEMQCESEEVTCEECPRGYELSPDALDCCRCVPKDTTCELKVKYETVNVEMPKKDGTNDTISCVSKGSIKVTSCQGFCASMDKPTFMIGGEVINHDKDCRCCSGKDYEEVDVEIGCDDDSSYTIQMQRFSECECNACAGADGPKN